MMHRLVRRLDDHLASEFLLTDDDVSTYADLKAKIADMEALLASKGIGAGHFVLLVGDFSLTSIATLLALALRGAICAPLSPSGPKRLAPQLELLKPHFAIDVTDETSIKTTSFAVDQESPVSQRFATGEPGIVVFTSGSTGTPKAIVHELNPLLEKFQRSRHPHRAIPFLLFDHMGGVNTVLSLVTSGGCIIQTSSRNVREICAAVERFRVTLLPTTPTFLNMLLASGEYRNFDMSSLKVITYGTEIMSEAVLQKLIEVMPDVNFKQTYGMSEIGVLVTSSRSKDTTWLKIGGDGIETKVVDGILWIKAKSRMLGYFDFAKGDAAWIEPSGDWFCTGDLVLQDEGYLKFMGRDSDIISVSGLKVYPSEVENCLLASPLVKDAYVRGDANFLTGKMVSAYVVLKDRVDASQAKKDLEKHCRERLERFKVPAKFTFLDAVGVSERFKKVRSAQDNA